MKLKVFRDFLDSKTGLAYVWAEFIISIPLSVAVYFPLSFAWEHLYVLIVGQYVFTGDTALGIAAIQLMLSYVLAIGLIFSVAHVLIQSHAQQYNSY